MYFQAFGMGYSPLDPEFIYVIEHAVSQLLGAADDRALRVAIEERRLTDMLLDELSFLGQIPDTALPQVREYLIQQEPSLIDCARRLVDEPDNDVIREELCTPCAYTVKR